MSGNTKIGKESLPNQKIIDVLLDPEIFAGVGNIIKNEVLFPKNTSKIYLKNRTQRQGKELIVVIKKYVQ